MSQADELINGLSDEEFALYTANPTGEQHIIVDENRIITVPSELKKIAVQYDHNIETVTFDCIRYWDGHDMSTMKVYINYTRSDKYTGCYLADNVRVDEANDSIMHFDWTISRNVTESVGPLTILVCVKMVDADGNEINHWNSERNTDMKISKGMECGDIIANKYPDVITYLLADMGNLADLTTEDKSSLVAAINEARQTGGGGVQPDWNQNDEIAADYIKNRPFYTGDPVETVLVEESTVTFDGINGLYVAEIRSSFEATVGETYKVSWDGTAYECACVKFNNNPAIGNLSILGAGSDTGEPFIMIILNGEGIVIATADTSASHTFSISGFVSEIVKIDPKYIRDMYYTGDPVETVLVEESTVPFSFSEGEGAYIGFFQSTFEATVGETYKVSWDGTAYECACVKFNNNPAIGNLSILGAGSDTGEPFIMIILNGEGIVIATADTSASHTFSISGFVSEIVKIDPKYLPDTIATKSEVEVAQSTANTAKTTAENAQTTAENAQSTANTAKTTAANAQTTADAAKTTADAAKTTADGCVKINNTGSFSINLSGKSRFFASDYGEESYYGFHKKSVTDKPIVLSIGASGGTALDISVTPSTSPTVKIIPPVYLNNMADIEIGEPSGYYRRPQITGLGGITMYSSTADSTKKFKITVDDSGTITATEVT